MNNVFAHSINLGHPFDLSFKNDRLDLLAEELPEQVQLLSDCASTASSLSCCGTAGSFSSMGSIISSGKTKTA